MESSFLDKGGFSVLEVTVVLFIMGVLLSMMIPNYVSRINQSKYEKTVDELTAIAQASIDYFNMEGSWPDPGKGLSQLAPQFMPHIVISSPFGTNYQIIPPIIGNNIITVTVQIPHGIALNNPSGELSVKSTQGAYDQIEISKTVPYETISRLSYCLHNLC